MSARFGSNVSFWIRFSVYRATFSGSKSLKARRGGAEPFDLDLLAVILAFTSFFMGVVRVASGSCDPILDRKIVDGSKPQALASRGS
jgi:hypothetical protein